MTAAPVPIASRLFESRPHVSRTLLAGAAGRGAVLALALVAMLGACANKDAPLPGVRIPVRPPDAPVAGAARAHPLGLPPASMNADWAWRPGSKPARVANPALRPVPQLIWSLDIGTGDSKRRRILVGPIVAGPFVYAMDANGQLSAATRDGRLAWSVNLAPPGQRPGTGPGGGMTVDGGTLFVATGFGEVLALDPSSGGIRWRQMLAAPVQAAPTLGGGRLIVVSRDDMAYGLDPQSGATLWQVQGIGGPGLLGGASPAWDGKVAILPFSSGEVQGVLARNGLQVWSTAVTGGRSGLARNQINDISGAPVLDGTGSVFASNQSGRTVRLDTQTGERAWTIPEGSYGPAWPVGGSLFLLSDVGGLVRADASTGELLWQVQLPELYPNPGWFGRGKPYEAIPYWGPVLAGGRLWVAGADGLLRGFAPADGTQVAQVPLPGGAAGAPAVAGGVMYLATRDGKLLAFQ